MVASCETPRGAVVASPSSKNATIAIGASRNGASSHLTKPVRPTPCKRQPESQTGGNTGRYTFFKSATLYPEQVIYCATTKERSNLFSHGAEVA